MSQMIGFLYGGVREGGTIESRLWYVLEEVSWLVQTLNFLDICARAGQGQNLKVVEASVLPSGGHGTSCMMLTGNLPDAEQFRRWLGWTFPSVPLTRPNNLGWEELPDGRRVPFQTLSLGLDSHMDYLRSKSPEYNGSLIPRRTAPTYVYLRASGLVYSFNTNDSSLATEAPPLTWVMLQTVLQPYRKEKSPKRQTVLIRQTQV